MTDRTNKKFWQRIAGVYAPLMESDQKFYETLCESIRPYLKRNMRVLELACGSGQLSIPLSPEVQQWIATDFSEAMIAQAQKRGGGQRLCFRVADAAALPFPDGGFDCVVISNALHIMPEPERAMEEIYRMLKPGGLLYAPTFLWAEGGASGLRRRLMSLAGFKIYHEWNREAFQTFIGSRGFTVLKGKLVNGGLAPVCLLIAAKTDAV